MSRLPYVRIHTDVFYNPKIVELRTKPEGDTYVLIWIMLLVLAGRCNENGCLIIPPGIIYDPPKMARLFKLPVKTVSDALEQFLIMDMILYHDGMFIIKNWEKYQKTEFTERKKEYMRNYMREYRKKKRDEPCKTNVSPIEEEEEIE